jgi:hypothetical protein
MEIALLIFILIALVIIAGTLVEVSKSVKEIEQMSRARHNFEMEKRG